PDRAQRERGDDRGGDRPAERNREQVAQHRAEHERSALREVHGVRHDVRDVEAEREQAVHATHAQAGDNGESEQFFLLYAPAGTPSERGSAAPWMTPFASRTIAPA